VPRPDGCRISIQLGVTNHLVGRASQEGHCTIETLNNAAVVNNLSLTSNPNFQVTFRLANTGAVAGAEVAQVYLGLPGSTNEPPKRLVGWQEGAAAARIRADGDHRGGPV
jgi:hypothetical protein